VKSIAVQSIVSKDALLEAVWPGTIVAEGVLTTSIGELRKVLRETATHPQFIATANRRGYRFVAPVTAVDHGETAASTPACAPRSVVPSCPVFVDREAELAQLQQWWTTATLYGPTCNISTLDTVSLGNHMPA
jgi:DNA-binding winged helix-turn-helix (wHTH) protein